MANEEHIERLEQGVKVWNAWREGHPEFRIDIDLKGADLNGVDLRGADLR
jgi:uncharacterized protein YjbI with pentapeptide repeats